MATLMQISANTGPIECCLAVTKLLAHLEKQSRAAGLSLTVVESVLANDGPLLRSVLLALEGEEGACARFATPYVGTILWTCPSPLRPNHKRRNWYLDVAQFASPSLEFSSEVRFETMRSSGPGGQHVNKTESAVRATHVATGLAVKVSGSRSQSSNKAAALALLSAKVLDLAEHAEAQGKASRRLRHCAKAGGVVAKRFSGPQFLEA